MTASGGVWGNWGPDLRSGSEVDHAMEELLASCGVRVVRTPAAAPDCNAHAERFVRSIKEECLERLVPVGEWHLRRAIREFVEHYHEERNHQGIGNALIERPPAQAGDKCGSSSCRRAPQLLLSVRGIGAADRSVGQNGISDSG
jgi:hypothetical protein